VPAGTISRSSPSRFAPSTSIKAATPVMLPPARLKVRHQADLDRVLAAGEDDGDRR
jgi:hypothetical protein